MSKEHWIHRPIGWRGAAAWVFCCGGVAGYFTHSWPATAAGALIGLLVLIGAADQ